MLRSRSCVEIVNRLWMLGVVTGSLGFALTGAVAQADGPTTVSFAHTGAEQTFSVPADVRSVQVTAVGGRGAGPCRPER